MTATTPAPYGVEAIFEGNSRSSDFEPKIEQNEPALEPHLLPISEPIEPQIIPPAAIDPEPEPKPIAVDPGWIARYRATPPEARSAWLDMFPSAIASAIAAALEPAAAK